MALPGKPPDPPDEQARSASAKKNKKRREKAKAKKAAEASFEKKDSAPVGACKAVAKQTPTINWNDPAEIDYGTPLSDQQLNATASTEGSFSYSPGKDAVLHAGQNIVLKVDFTPADTAKYNNASKTVKINVRKLTPEIEWEDPKFIYYGTPLSGTQLNATAKVKGAAVSGVFKYDPPDGKRLDFGKDQPLKVTFTPNDKVNYNTPPPKQVKITVAKAIPLIEWKDPAAIEYRTKLSSIQLNAAAVVNGAPVAGSFSYDPPDGALLTVKGGPKELKVTFTPNDKNNYQTPKPATVKITILKATPVITWNNPADIVYGTKLDGTQLNATASVPGSFKYNPPANTTLNAGNGRDLNVEFNPQDYENYNAATKTVKINVLKADQDISWGPSDIALGGKIGADSLNAALKVGDGALTYAPVAGTQPAAVNNAYQLTVTAAETANFKRTEKTMTIKVCGPPAAVTPQQKVIAKITPQMEQKILYGEEKPSKPGQLRGAHSTALAPPPPVGYQTQLLSTNDDGTRTIRVRKQLPSGAYTSPKISTIPPAGWNDDSAMAATVAVGNTPAKQSNAKGDTLHRSKVNGVEWEVIKDKNGNVKSSYPNGGVKTVNFT